MNTFDHQICPIAEMGFDQRLGAYLLSIKVGKYQTFNTYLHTNQRHYHDCYELVLVLDGHGSFEYKGTDHTLKSGDLFLSEPFTEHEIHITPSGSLKVFYLFFKVTLDNTLVNHCYEEQLLDAFIERHVAYTHKDQSLLSYLNFLNDYGDSSQRKNDHWIGRIVFDFLFNSLEHLCKKPPKQATSIAIHEINTFERILDYIDQNIEGKITALTIAQAIGLSKSTLYNMFREHLNCTVHAYIKERKTALAKHYLLMNLPVSEVAGLVGYESLAQFSRTFKTQVGIAPSTYAKQYSKIPMGIGRRLI